MSTPKPCPYCGNTQLLVVPNLAFELSHLSSLIGMKAFKNVPGIRWQVTLVVCTVCTSTQFFTSNGPELQQHVPGANIIQTPPAGP